MENGLFEDIMKDFPTTEYQIINRLKQSKDVLEKVAHWNSYRFKALADKDVGRILNIEVEVPAVVFSYLPLLQEKIVTYFVLMFLRLAYGEHWANYNCIYFTLRLCKIYPSGLIRQYTRDPNFFNSLLVTNEPCFTWNEITNFRKPHA